MRDNFFKSQTRVYVYQQQALFEYFQLLQDDFEYEQHDLPVHCTSLAFLSSTIKTMFVIPALMQGVNSLVKLNIPEI